MAEGRTFVPDPINTRYSEDTTGQYEDSIPVFIRAESGLKTLQAIKAAGDEAVTKFGHALIEAVEDTAASRQPRYFNSKGELKARPKTDDEVQAMVRAALELAGVDPDSVPAVG